MMENMSDNRQMELLESNFREIEERIGEAAEKSGRTRKDITFLAATKTVEPARINHAVSLGLDAIGENRVQELLEKYDQMVLPPSCECKFIGHLQTNKVRQIIEKVSMIQSVDSIRLASEIERQAQKIGKKMRILLEVNIGREENKSGVMPEALLELACQIAEQMPSLQICGLMAIPPICREKSRLRKYFSDMRQLFIDIGDKKIDNINMYCLSMGMSGDYEDAILEGATMVRIGSALFGARQYYK